VSLLHAEWQALCNLIMYSCIHYYWTILNNYLSYFTIII